MNNRKEKERLSPKVLAVYQGVWSVYEKTGNFNQIRVSEIAKASGVPKGTIYEYFASKEEIIAGAILFHMRNQLDGLIVRIENEQGFKNRVFTIFSWILEKNQRKLFVSRINNLSEFPGDLQKALAEEKERCGCNLSDYNFVIENLYDLGVKEEILLPGADKFKKDCGLPLALGVLFNYVANTEKYAYLKEEEVKEYAYRILVLSLNAKIL